jgi:hypothetical protein
MTIIEKLFRSDPRSIQKSNKIERSLGVSGVSGVSEPAGQI